MTTTRLLRLILAAAALCVCAPNAAAATVSAGERHSCGIQSDATVKCWGFNDLGQVGAGTLEQHWYPDATTVTDLQGATSLSSGARHTCAIVTSGQVRCWGSGLTGQTGSGGYNVGNARPVTVSGLAGAAAISAGSGHTCVVKTDGTVWCWGDNRDRQLGTDDSGDGGSYTKAVPVQVSGVTNAVAVASGAARTCALRSGGEVICWGAGTPAKSTPQGLSSGVRSVSVGSSHACAVKTDGTVWCWGSNSSGQLGNGGPEQSDTPVQVTGVSDAASVSAGWRHTCALRAGGTAVCWGANRFGQLGNGAYAIGSGGSATVAVAGLTGATEIATGSYHTCAATADGASCWGDGSDGQTGYGPASAVKTPITLASLMNPPSFLLAGALRQCAYYSSSQLSCWGSNESGQLGQTDVLNQLRPASVPDISNMGAPAIGGRSQLCIALMDMTVSCRGAGRHGALGNGSTSNSSSGVTVSGLTDAAEVRSGDDFSCALRAGGTVVCWGLGTSGQLGDGAASSSSTPVPAAGLNGVVTMASGSAHTCAVRYNGTVWCWGAAPAATSATPAQVAGIDDATGISAGFRHTCAYRRNGKVSCWGATDRGQIGLISAAPVTAPTELPAFTNAVSVAVGGENTCAIYSDSTAKCWGAGTRGQLGNNDDADSASPQLVLGLPDVKSIAVGGEHICALTNSGLTRCWGDGANGQMGDGAAPDGHFGLRLTVSRVAGTTAAGLPGATPTPTPSAATPAPTAATPAPTPAPTAATPAPTPAPTAAATEAPGPVPPQPTAPAAPGPQQPGSAPQSQPVAGLKKKSVKVATGGLATFALTCPPQGCPTGKAKLTAKAKNGKTLTLGSAAIKNGKVKIKLSASARAQLKKARKIKAQLRIASSPAITVTLRA